MKRTKVSNYNCISDNQSINGNVIFILFVFHRPISGMDRRNCRPATCPTIFIRRQSISINDIVCRRRSKRRRRRGKKGTSNETYLTSLVFQRCLCDGKCSARGRLSRLSGRRIWLIVSLLTATAREHKTRT